ncbi:hypothetical protein OEZ60_00520 [Defluviimonas sp. WL0024]|uniref:Uncharacterized protein n=1 Tax=Albidovulum salinarum TaxID=2984153 RepID=A0ABT2X0D2_9RHOB|nr:hypothetical protein [Defluviimonas sp. WL0024]MCU9846487.1 hypothetical protein [Defluviimonas sp. WL0024]
MEYPRQMDAGQERSEQTSVGTPRPRQQSAEQPVSRQQQSEGERVSGQMGATIFTDWASI